MGIMADLHCHSNASDGALPPAEVVAVAVQRGLRVLALTDHDTVAGIATVLQAGMDNNLLVIAGVELSTIYGEQEQEAHLLGFGIDWQYQPLTTMLAELQQAREKRVELMVGRLQQQGLAISLGRVQELAGDGSMGRAHVARALVETGAVASVDEAFRSWLVQGAPAFVPRMKITPEEAVTLIHQAGGLAVLAHPGLDGAGDLIPRLVEAGLDGLEVYYPEHSPELETHFLALAVHYGLLVTGGSDFHGPWHGAQLGDCGIAGEHLEQFLQALPVRG